MDLAGRRSRGELRWCRRGTEVVVERMEVRHNLSAIDVEIMV